MSSVTPPPTALPERKNALGYLLVASGARSNKRREFRFAEDVTRSAAWANEKDVGRDGLEPSWLGPFTDALTNERVLVRPSSCGSRGCYCAAEWRRIA